MTMSRTLPITAAEWASIRTEGDPATFSATGGRMVRTLWLVARGNEHWLMAPDEPKLISATPPVEFVQACAPCETCGDDRTVAADDGRGGLCDLPCPDCRIELVGPCPECGGDGWTAEHDSSCDGYERCYALGCPVQVQCASCQFTGIATLGHAYAVGKPLPIAWGVCDLSVPFVGVWRPPYPPTVLFLDPDEDGTPIDLAHAGPVEWLVGKWAIRLEVVG